MQINHPHEIVRLLGRNAYAVYSLLCFAEMEGIAPVGRDWLVDNMAGPVSPNTITRALRVLTGPECQLVVRVSGGWRAAGKAFQLPLGYLLSEKDSESLKDSENPLDSQSPKDSGNPFKVVGVVSSPPLSSITTLTTTTTYRKKKVSENPKDSESPKDSERSNDPRLRACLDLLKGYGVYGRKARQIAELEWVTPEYIRAHMEDTAQEDGKWQSPVGMALYRIQEHAPLPGKRAKRDDDDDRSKYIRGKYADIIQH